MFSFSSTSDTPLALFYFPIYNFPINATSKLIAHDSLDYTPQPHSLQGVKKDCKYESFKKNPIPKPSWYEIIKLLNASS
jgi:hypothetical protein